MTASHYVMRMLDCHMCFEMLTATVWGLGHMNHGLKFHEELLKMMMYVQLFYLVVY